jgi:hypothetical protein
MAVLNTTPQAHHSWWAGLVAAGLDAIRHLFKLNDEESAAWDTVVMLVKSLLP